MGSEMCIRDRPINQPTNQLPSFLPDSMDVPTAEETPKSAVVVTKLNFTYDGMDSPVLKDFDLDLPAGSRCIAREKLLPE